MKLTLDGQSHEFTPDETGYFWDALVPVCPCCAEELLTDRETVPVRHHVRSEALSVECEHCGWVQKAEW